MRNSRSAAFLRNISTETPSDRKNRELFEQAHSGRGVPTWGTIFHGRRCDLCRYWETCRKEVGESSAGNNYCSRKSRGFEHKDRAAA